MRMSLRRLSTRAARLALAIPLAFFGGPALAAGFKVLVVMSYEEDNPWVREIREGIESVLGPENEIRVFHMNTKVDRAAGPKRAEEARALVEQFRPDGVIAADDDAQEMFVVPFLKDRTGTPVMFNGVNADPARYGYPARNVSGVLERAHVRESLSFARQFVPSIRSVCFLTNDVPAGQSLRTQVLAEQGTYPAKVAAFHLVSTTSALKGLARPLRASCDALFVDSLEGIADPAGRPLTNAEIMKLLPEVYAGPILAGNRYQVEQGAWAAVVKTGQEQGAKSAEMLLQAMRGTAVSALPVVRNAQGQRIINITELEKRRVVLKPMLLRGATLVREQP